ncbi:WhiB family transcriptional regulator [Rhodococcus sp. NPDC057135]|uniref:WhiB family transcriptional regulator n=1 Tax=Rhodococcus sp. NPDC057135 TaxID=3346028 RepID=UPI0036374185
MFDDQRVIGDRGDDVTDQASVTASPCQSHNPDLWFSTTRSELTRAMMLCRSCPRSQRCFLDALDRGETAGVWGGRYLVDGKIAALPGVRTPPLGRQHLQ